jgi:hypothetical protein
MVVCGSTLEKIFMLVILKSTHHVCLLLGLMQSIEMVYIDIICMHILNICIFESIFFISVHLDIYIRIFSIFCLSGSMECLSCNGENFSLSAFATGLCHLDPCRLFGPHDCDSTTRQFQGRNLFIYIYIERKTLKALSSNIHYFLFNGQTTQKWRLGQLLVIMMEYHHFSFVCKRNSNDVARVKYDFICWNASKYICIKLNNPITHSPIMEMYFEGNGGGHNWMFFVN